MSHKRALLRTATACAMGLVVSLCGAACGNVRAGRYDVTDAAHRGAEMVPGFAREALSLRHLARNYLANRGFRDAGLNEEADAEIICAVDGRRQCRDLESAISRRVGRMILNELCGEPRVTPATVIPEMDQKTDYWTAFREGWAAHFDSVAFDHSGFPEDAKRDLERSLGALRWWNNRMAAEGPRPGAATLLFPVWHTRHKWAAVIEATKGRGFADAYRGSPTGMPATPGIVSSVIYALVTDPRIQSTYREPRFYRMFESPSSGSEAGDAPGPGGSPAERFSPLENAYMKLFHVLASSIRPDPIMSRPSPVLTLITEYVREFPGEEEAAYDAFLWATGGATLEPATAGRLRASVGVAMPYEMEQRARFIDRLRGNLLNGERRIDASAGPQLWLLNVDSMQGLCAYDMFGVAGTPRSFDINTADAAELMSIPGVSPGMAGEIMAARPTAGGFTNIRDLAQVRSITPEALNSIHSMKSAMDRAMEAGGPLDGLDASLEQIAASYLAGIASRLLAAFFACSGTLVAVDYMFSKAQRRYFGGWVPPIWLDAQRSAWRWSFSLLLKVTGGMVALGMLFLIMPPLPPLSRLLAGAGTALVIWLGGALPQVLGISAFAGLAGRYASFRAVWSLARLVAVAAIAFLTV